MSIFPIQVCDIELLPRDLAYSLCYVRSAIHGSRSFENFGPSAVLLQDQNGIVSEHTVALLADEIGFWAGMVWVLCCFTHTFVFVSVQVLASSIIFVLHDIIYIENKGLSL